MTIRAMAPAITILYSLTATITSANAAPPETYQGRQIETVVLSDPDMLVSYGRLGGVAIDQYNNLFVTNFHDSLWRVSPGGDVKLIRDDLHSPSGVAATPNGDILVAEFLANRVSLFDRSGNLIARVESGLSLPVGVLAKDDNSFYVVNCRANTLLEMDFEGGLKTLASGDDFACANGLTKGPDGALYVVSFSNTKIVRVTPEGEQSVFTTLPGVGNAHIAFAGGHFYVTQINTHTIYRVATDGRYELVAGTGQVGDDDGPAMSATMAWPNGVAAAADGRSIIFNTLEGDRLSFNKARIELRRLLLPSIQRTLFDLGNDGQHKKMITALSTALAAPDADLDALGQEASAAARALSYQNRHESALILLEQLVEDFPQSARLHIQLAQSAMWAGDHKRARSAIGTAAALAPESPAIKGLEATLSDLE